MNTKLYKPPETALERLKKKITKKMVEAWAEFDHTKRHTFDEIIRKAQELRRESGMM